MTNTILTDLSVPALGNAVKLNMLEFFRLLGDSEQADLFVDSTMARWLTGLEYSWFNGILFNQPPTDADENRVRGAVEYFRSRGVKDFTAWLEPQVDPVQWERLLGRHGFVYETSTPGLAMDLARLPAALTLLPNFSIKPVSDIETLRVWSHIFILGYGLPESWEDKFFEMMENMGLDLPVRNYLGLLDGNPVTTSTLFLGAGVAGIYCVATLPEARGRGLGGAMTLVPLYQSRDLGYRISILQSSEMGFNLYQKLGYQHVSQVDCFVWQGENR